jgi:ABC-type transport system substrate-binding protein
MKNCIKNSTFSVAALPWLMGLLLIGWALPVAAQKPKTEISPGNAQLVDKEPFDRIYLDEFNEYATLDVVPLENIPTKPYPNNGMLVFEWVEDDEFKLEVPWGNVVDYRTFNDLLLAEADLLREKQEYSRVFRNLLYVYDNGNRDDIDLEKQLQRILVLDADQNFENKNYGLALSIFEDVYRSGRSGNFKGKVINRIMQCYDLMVQTRFDDGEYEGCRAVLTAVERNYGDEVKPLQDRWMGRLTTKNQEFVAAARKAVAAGNGQEAHAAARKAIYALPNDQASADLLNQIITEYPLVYVGVSQSAPNGGDPTRIENWAARRMGRLTQRTIVEFDGLSDEGGKYRFLNGALERIDDDGLIYQFKISDKEEFGVPAVTAFQISQQLLDRADPDSPLYYEPWGKVVGPVSIDNPTTVTFHLRIPFVRPEALLQVPYERPDEKGIPLQNGPYTVVEQNDKLTTFSKNPIYKTKPESQYPEMVEVNFQNPSESVDALIKGDIDVVDRVPLQDLRKLSRNPTVQLRKYIVPTIHMLVPNIRNDFMQSLDFRSGLFRGIDRDNILQEAIAGGREISGCELLTGPFPIGTEDNDQIGYAYNPRVAPVNYDKILASVLVQVVKEQLEDKAREKRAAERIKENGGLPPEGANNQDDVIKLDFPELVLAHPKGETQRVTCTAIKRMWGEMGITVTLRELPEGKSSPDDNDFDFLYVEVAMSEPLTDVETVFGNAGMANNLSAPVQQLVRKLSYSTSWQVAGRNLRQMHRQVLNNVSIIPLFQIQEYFAYRRNVKNLGRDLVNLYENIDEWEVVPLESPSTDGN